MSCTCKIFNTAATIGSTFVLQFRLKDDDGEIINITEYRVKMTAKSKAGVALFTADTDEENGTLTLDAEDGATITVLVPENTAPQVADYDVLIADNSAIISIIRGTIKLMPQITDLTL